MPYSSKQKSSNKNKKSILLVIILLLLLISAGVYFFFFRGSNGDSNNTSTITDGINYGPPTEQEQESGDKIKDTITKDQASTPTNSTPTPQENGDTSSYSNLVISDASQYGSQIEVRAFVPNIFSNGSCTLTFSLGSFKVEKQTSASSDATSSICANTVVERSEFQSPGKWSLEVIYSGLNGSKARATTEVDIQ